MTRTLDGLESVLAVRELSSSPYWQITLCDSIDKWFPVVLRWISLRTIRSFTFYLYLLLQSLVKHLTVKITVKLLDFVVDRFCVKLFKTSDMQSYFIYSSLFTIFCRVESDFKLPSSVVDIKKFVDNGINQYSLRKRGHPFQLPTINTTLLRSTFINRCLLQFA